MSNSESKNNDSATVPTEELDLLIPDETTEEAPAVQPVAQDAVDDFEYVIPARRKKHRHHRHHRHHHHHHSESGSSSASPIGNDVYDDFVYIKSPKKKRHKHHKHRKHRRHHKKWPLWLKILVGVAGAILAIVLIVTATFFILRGIGRNAMHDYSDVDISVPVKDDDGKDIAKVLDSGRTIKYGGKTYLLNEDVMTVTFIGYNQEDVGESNNYMADAIYIAAVDAYSGKSTILGISRDTMLDVDVYSAEGRFINTEKKQLSYAYSYGNNTVTGGKNVNTSLSRLFFGLPLNNYFAIDLNALEDLNDAIGGVGLTSMMTFESKEGLGTVHEGDQVILRGKDAVTYVQSRDITDLNSNNTRMDRQQQYIMAFLSSIVPAAKRDLSTITKLYGVVNKNADSTLDLPKVTYLASTALEKMKSASEIETIRLKGKIKAGEHAEMYLNDKDVLETMLKVFYTPVS